MKILYTLPDWKIKSHDSQAIIETDVNLQNLLTGTTNLKAPQFQSESAIILDADQDSEDDEDSISQGSSLNEKQLEDSSDEKSEASTDSSESL